MSYDEKGEFWKILALFLFKKLEKMLAIYRVNFYTKIKVGESG